jgi:hypothetical protein
MSCGGSRGAQERDGPAHGNQQDQDGANDAAVRVKKLESVVKRQRSVVKEQQASISLLIERVEELQASLKSKDDEITSLKEQCVARKHTDSALPSLPDGRPLDPSLKDELLRHRHEILRMQDQLAAAHEREHALQVHIKQLQRK